MKKIGPHLINDTEKALEWARHAPIVKALSRTTAFEVARPGAIKVFRRFFQGFEQNDLSNPQGTYTAIMEQLGNYRDPHLYVEIYNEIYQFMGTGLPVYADFLEKIVPLFHAQGIKVCGPSWSTGAYQIDEWVYMRNRGWVGLDAILVHGYWANYGFTKWNALRWAQYWEPGDPPVINTEAGRDAVRDKPEGQMSGNGGWKADNLTADEYLVELQAYDLELQKRPECLGAVIFTAGATTDWQNYNTDDLDIPKDLSWETPEEPEEPPIEEEPPMTEPQYILGFKAFHDQHPEIGDPTSEEWYEQHETPSKDIVTIGKQLTSNGYLLWNKRTGQVQFFRAALS